MRQNFEFTSEAVSEGHPDKMADRISDSIVDLYFREAEKAGVDPSRVRVAAETMVTDGHVFICGEVGGLGFDLPHSLIDQVAREAIRDIGYEEHGPKGFHWEFVPIKILLHHQSEDIAHGVDNGGAGDQGSVIGFACNGEANYMPHPVYYANRILENLGIGRKAFLYDLLGPDAKTQITVKYKDSTPIEVSHIVLSTQQVKIEMDSSDIKKIVEPYIQETLPVGWITDKTVWHVNPAGKFITGGPVCDCGLTGRKLEVDTYGGFAPHGGGAFSGKDPTKVDRSAAYAARYLSKNIVAAGYAERCTIQISYAIGVAEPLYISVDTDGTGPDNLLEKTIPKIMDLTPRGIIKHLNLLHPIYSRTSCYGHFGRNLFSWERVDLINELGALLG